MTQKPFVLSAKAVIRDGDGRCLMIQRSRSSGAHKLKWELPGGKNDPGGGDAHAPDCACTHGGSFVGFGDRPLPIDVGIYLSPYQ